jgi:phage baseplate assembly protein W
MPDPIKDFLGSGWAFPPRLDARGQIEMAHQEVDVEQAILIILRTHKGERPMRPLFGSDLFRLQFLPLDAGTAGQARRYVQEALSFWEPRIEVAEVVAEPDARREACLRISIRYRIIATNSERNLVFPFYVIPGEG